MITQCLFNSNNFATSTALAEVRSLLSACRNNVREILPLKLRPYGTVKIQLLLLLLEKSGILLLENCGNPVRLL